MADPGNGDLLLQALGKGAALLYEALESLAPDLKGCGGGYGSHRGRAECTLDQRRLAHQAPRPQGGEDMLLSVEILDHLHGAGRDEETG